MARKVNVTPPSELTDDSQIAVRLATFDQYRGLLFSIAYRMLGTVADAEDMLQDTFIRWQQAKDEDIRSPRAFLVTIISRLCINHLQSARVQREEYSGQWLPEPLVTDPAADPLQIFRIDESLSTAFLVLLERLTPIERAVLLLRDVFEYGYSEISAILGRTEANCRQILRRAREHINAMRPRFQAPARKQSELLERFLEAVGSGDLSGLVELLAGDVVLHTDGGGKGIAVPNVVRGVDKVARGMLGAQKKLIPEGVVRRIVQINGAPGIISYRDEKPFSAVTVDVERQRIRAIYVVTNPEKLAHLPSQDELLFGPRSYETGHDDESRAGGSGRASPSGHPEPPFK